MQSFESSQTPENFNDPLEGGIEVKSDVLDTRAISTPLGEIFSSFSTAEAEHFQRDVLIPEGITQEMIEHFPTEDEREGSPLKNIQVLLIRYHDSSIDEVTKQTLGTKIANMIKNPK